MSVRFRIYIIVFIFLCHTGRRTAVFSQERTASYGSVVPDSANAFRGGRMGFERLINTYHWNFLAAQVQQVDLFSFNVREEFHSTLIRSENNFIKDEQSLSSYFRYRFSGNVQGQVQLSSFILSDNQSLGISNASSNAVYGGVEYKPISEITMEPLFGYRFEQQKVNDDKGISYQFSAVSPGIDIEGYSPSFTLLFHKDQLSPRMLENHHIGVSLEKYFEGRTKNSFSFLYTKNRREFYLPASNNIDKRIEQAYSFADGLDYEFDRQFLLSVQGNVLTRTVDKSPNTTIDEFKLETSGELSYAFQDSFRVSTRLLYSERDEKHIVPDVNQTPGTFAMVGTTTSTLEQLQDNFSQRTMLSVNGGFPLSQSDDVFIQSSASILRYDTPSKENVEDRDELWYAFSLVTSHRISPVLRMRIISDASATHLVYLFAERSANNAWNRTIRLAPIVDFAPGKTFSSTNVFEVLANYTVYDYQDLLGDAVKSFSFRQFSLYDSTVYQFARRLQFCWFSQVKLYGRGELRWEAFTERPINTYEEMTFIPQFRFIPFSGKKSSYCSAGVRYFKRLQFAGSGKSRTLEQSIFNIGPIASFVMDVGNNTRLAFDGWHEFQIEPKVKNRSNTNLSLQLQYKI